VNFPARPRFVFCCRPAATFLLIAASISYAQAQSTHAAPPPPAPFLAPPPLTSDQPEAPPIIDHPTPQTIVPASSATNPAPETPAPSAPNTNSSNTSGPAPMPHPMRAATPSPLRFLDPAGDPDHLADHLLVVYNAADPESKSLALYYARRRQIPAERVLALSCPTREEITRDEFEGTIHQPIVADLLRHHWLERRAETARLPHGTVKVLAATRNDIWAIVLMRGVPLKIADAPSSQQSVESEPGLTTTAAAVDSELALLPVEGLPLGGFVPNPFFDSYNSGEVRAGPELAIHLVLVTRLDGPTASDVRRMIDDCLEAEKNRLAGEAVIDTRGFTDPKNPYTTGDVWLRDSRDLLADDGWSVVFDEEAQTLPATSTVNQVALYLGWYTPNADGPWITPPDRFVRGAIAYHVHSFSAATVRSTTQNWVGPLIDHGADATMGCVYEPYLALTPHVEIFTRRLLDGDSFAEAAYACQPGLSWMITVVGDPLYQPFQQPIEEAIAAAPPGRHHEWLLLQQINRQLDGQPTTSAVALEKVFNVPGAGPVLAEHLGDLLLKLHDPAAPADAARAYQSALKQNTEPVDCIRVGLKLAQLDAAQKEDALARAELRSLREDYPLDATRFGVPDGLPPASRKGAVGGR
jgi:uncharacterized protein (TIGR03790 family)